MTHEQLVEMVEFVHRDLGESDRHRRMGQEMYQRMRVHYHHDYHGDFDYFCRKIASDSLLMAIRRHSDDQGGASSLRNVVVGILETPHDDRAKFKSAVDETVLRADLETMKTVREKRIKVADLRIAHPQPKAKLPNQTEPWDKPLDDLLQILGRCSLILTGTDYSIPVVLLSWNTIFDKPWDVLPEWAERMIAGTMGTPVEEGTL